MSKSRLKILCFVWFFTCSGGNGEQMFRPTFSQEDLDSFCINKSNSEQLPQKSYTHPHYCSRYITCTKGTDVTGKESIVATEKICDRCPETAGILHNNNNPTRKPRHRREPCEFGHLHWDESSQSCEPPNGKCNQSELSVSNVWGRKDVAHLCKGVPVGKLRTFPDPFHCGKYITCQRDQDYFRDLWVGVESCPICDTSDPGCPNGYMHYYLQKNGNNSICHLTTEIPKLSLCDPKSLQSETVNHIETPPNLSLTTPFDVQKLSTVKQALDTKTFCRQKEKVSKRYPVPGKCNAYYHCYAELQDDQLKKQRHQKVFHYKFICDTCADANITSDNCKGKDHLQFNFEEQNCTIPVNGVCRNDGSFIAKEQEKAQEAKSESPTPMQISEFPPMPSMPPIPSIPSFSENKVDVPKRCSLRKFVQHGYCKHYFTCDKKTKKEKRHECSGMLYWNPDVNSIHGGTCDYLRNIENETLYRYKKDQSCPLHIAYFRYDEELACSGAYYYQHPNRTSGKEIQLHCPEDLIWSKEAKTCIRCWEATQQDGVTPCCQKPEDDDSEDR